MPEFAVWALGVDRPGIVAAVTGVLYEQGCNLEDCSMTILSGHFAMMLLVRAPDATTASTLEDALAPAAEPLGLTMAVRPVEVSAAAGAGGEPYMVAVYGADRPGIVHRVSTVLAGAGLNITDLNTRVIGDPDQPVYAMHLEVTVPAGTDVEAVARQLRQLAGGLGVDTSIHPVEADVL